LPHQHIRDQCDKTDQKSRVEAILVITGNVELRA
jgi:hypothetical protein